MKTPRDIIIAELSALPGTLHKQQLTADRVLAALDLGGFQIVRTVKLLNIDGTENQRANLRAEGLAS